MLSAAIGLIVLGLGNLQVAAAAAENEALAPTKRVSTGRSSLTCRGRRRSLQKHPAWTPSRPALRRCRVVRDGAR
jgi:hypothetical protein